LKISVWKLEYINTPVNSRGFVAVGMSHSGVSLIAKMRIYLRIDIEGDIHRLSQITHNVSSIAHFSIDDLLVCLIDFMTQTALLDSKIIIIIAFCLILFNVHCNQTYHESQ